MMMTLYSTSHQLASTVVGAPSGAPAPNVACTQTDDVASSVAPVPTPQVSPATTTSPHLNDGLPFKILQTQQSNGTNNNHHSPACSVATQTAELLWDSPSTVIDIACKPSRLSMSAMAPPESNEEDEVYAPDSYIAGMTVVLSGLVAKGDAQFDRRKAKDQSRQKPIAAVIRDTLELLRDAGLFNAALAVCSTIYFNRLSQVNPKFITRFNVKRQIVAAAMIANKICSDTYYAISVYCTVTKLSAESISDSEWNFLANLDYDVQVSVSEFESMTRLLQDWASAVSSETIPAVHSPSGAFVE